VNLKIYKVLSTGVLPGRGPRGSGPPSQNFLHGNFFLNFRHFSEALICSLMIHVPFALATSTKTWVKECKKIFVCRKEIRWCFVIFFTKTPKKLKKISIEGLFWQHPLAIPLAATNVPPSPFYLYYFLIVRY